MYANKIFTSCWYAVKLKYRLNTENGGFTPDKFPRPNAPRDLSAVKPTSDIKHDQGRFVKEIPKVY